jgi:hypothetical protein
MLKHIVMWKFKEHAEGADKATNLRRAKVMLNCSISRARPRWSPAARAAWACRWPTRWARQARASC